MMAPPCRLLVKRSQGREEKKKKQEDENKRKRGWGMMLKSKRVAVKVNISIKRDSTPEFDCLAFLKVSGHCWRMRQQGEVMSKRESTKVLSARLGDHDAFKVYTPPPSVCNR